MNALDIAVFVLVGLLVFNGVRKGIIISLATLIGLLLGLYAAIHFSNYTTKFLTEHFQASASWLPILSFTITFMVVIFLVILIGKVIEKMVSIAGMGLLNHLLGGVLGLIKGIIFVSVVLFIITSFDVKERLITPKVKKESLVYQQFAKVFPKMVELSK